jgi:peptidoglycan/xylan/chitin deacetylase (PgdA/CDA1 family)
MTRRRRTRRRKLKELALGVCKAAGLFALAERLTARRLRILCYHGFSTADESAWRPRVFMEVETFRARLAFLERRGYPVLALADALARLDRGDLPPRATVITIDDGYWSFYRHALPILRERSLPATLYVISHWALSGEPVFDLAVRYMLWKTSAERLDLTPLGIVDGVPALDTPDARDSAVALILRHAERLGDRQRARLARALGERLAVDYTCLTASRALGLVDKSEIAALAAQGIDIQLHTHRHRFPEDHASALREIAENRAALEPMVGRCLEHFCYPRGQWSPRHWPWLREAGIASATTCEPGLNGPRTPRLALRRFLDGEDVSPIEFEAEMTGFAEFLRGARRLLRRAFPGSEPRAPEHAAEDRDAAAAA